MLIPVRSKQSKRGATMKRVIVESPFAGDVERNIAYARLCLRDCLLKGEAPIASHLLYTQPNVLDDKVPDERNLGIAAGLMWGCVAETTIVYTDYGMSNGMRLGVQRAESEGRPIEYRKLFNGMLTPQEQKTLESYKKIATARAKTHANPDFWQPEFERFQKLLPNGKVIDIGCGSGRDAILFTVAGYDYTGVDISDEMLSEAKKLVPAANFVKGNAYSLDFPSQTLDGFWAAASLLHIPKINASLVLQEIRRVVRDNGVGFIAMKEGEGEQMVRGSLEGDERFFSFYTDSEFLQLLQNNGFEVIEHLRDTREYNPPKDLTIWLLYLVRVKHS